MPHREGTMEATSGALRAPDPTLMTANTLVIVKFEGPLAHLLDDDDPYSGLRCDAPDDGADIPMASRHAAYIAVPCQECFPDAMPLDWLRERIRQGWDRHLAWQLDLERR